MSRTIVIMVCDNSESIESARKYWEGHDVSFQVFAPNQWREGLNNNFFRQQLVQGLPALTVGLNPINENGYTGNVVPFPTGGANNDAKVQKMEELEARAIEEAIHQFKGIS